MLLESIVEINLPYIATRLLLVTNVFWYTVTALQFSQGNNLLKRIYKTLFEPWITQWGLIEEFWSITMALIGINCNMNHPLVAVYKNIKQSQVKKKSSRRQPIEMLSRPKGTVFIMQGNKLWWSSIDCLAAYWIHWLCWSHWTNLYHAQPGVRYVYRNLVIYRLHMIFNMLNL